MNAIVPVKGGRLQRATAGIPEILVRAGPNAIFAAEEFFKATINNAHTKRAYGRSVARFLAWCEHKAVELREITPGLAAAYAQANKDIRSFIETTGIPFLPMSMAKGLLPDNHLQSAAAARSFAIGQADVVMLIGARLNWLFAHGKSPLWSDSTQYAQVDISPTEIDSNRPIAAPVVGDIKSAIAAFLAALKPNQIQPSAEWLAEIAQRKQKNIEHMAARLNADPNPMDFSSALRAVRAALADKPDVYVVNDRANTLDLARNIIDMYEPRRRLDSGT